MTCYKCSFGPCGPQQPCLCGVLLRSLLPPVPGRKVYRGTERGPGSLLILSWMLRMPCCLSHLPTTLSLPLLLLVRTISLLPAQLWDRFPTMSALPFPCVYQIIFMVFSLPEDSSFFPLPPFSLVSPLLTLLSSLLLSFPITDLPLRVANPQALTYFCKLSSSRKH